MINGRTLLLLDATALVRMNIKDFKHITVITKAIRDLYQIENILFNRSISLPPRYPDTHYQLYRIYNGPKYDLCTRTQLWKKMKMIKNAEPFEDHWSKLTKWFQHIHLEKNVLFGKVYRYNLFQFRNSPGFKPYRSDSYDEYEKYNCCCIPPCECEWTEKHYTQPWVLNCLLDNNHIKLNEHSIDKEDVVTVVDDGLNQIDNFDHKTNSQIQYNLIPCTCILPCECQWAVNAMKYPWVLSILKVNNNKNGSARV